MSPDVVTDTEWTRPIPRPDAVSAPYWEAAARGELVIQECKSCGHRVEPEVSEQVAHHGSTMTVIDWAARLVCSRCGTREADFVVTGARR